MEERRTFSSFLILIRLHFDHLAAIHRNTRTTNKDYIDELKIRTGDYIFKSWASSLKVSSWCYADTMFLNSCTNLTQSTFSELVMCNLLKECTNSFIEFLYFVYLSKLVYIYCSYLVTTFKIVPRGTEGAVSLEGTFAGILASLLLASVGYVLGQVKVKMPSPSLEFLQEYWFVSFYILLFVLTLNLKVGWVSHVIICKCSNGMNVYIIVTVSGKSMWRKELDVVSQNSCQTSHVTY